MFELAYFTSLSCYLICIFLCRRFGEAVVIIVRMGDGDEDDNRKKKTGL